MLQAGSASLRNCSSEPAAVIDEPTQGTAAQLSPAMPAVLQWANQQYISRMGVQPDGTLPSRLMQLASAVALLPLIPTSALNGQRRVMVTT